MDLSKLNTGDKIVSGTGILLLISLVALPWHSISMGSGFGSFTRTAIQSPESLLGFLGLLIAIFVAGSVIASKAFGASLPDLPISWSDARFYAAAAGVALLILKYIMNSEIIGYGAYIAILSAAGMTYGAFTEWQAAKAGGGAASEG